MEEDSDINERISEDVEAVVTALKEMVSLIDCDINYVTCL